MKDAEPLAGVSENRKQLNEALRFLFVLLPCPKQQAIAVLHFKTGRSTRQVREEIIDAAINTGVLLEDELGNISLIADISILNQFIRSILPSAVTDALSEAKNVTPKKIALKDLPAPTPQEIKATAPEFYCEICGTDYGGRKLLAEHNKIVHPTK